MEVVANVEKYEQIIDLLATKIPREFIVNNLYLAGGCVRDISNNKEPKDYDFFMRTDKTEELKELTKDNRLYISKNSIGFNIEGKEIQIVLCTHGSPIDVTGEFDFLNNVAYYCPISKFPLTHIEVYNNRLCINRNARNLMGTLGRISKFVETKGFLPPAMQDMSILGIRLTQLDPITKVSQLVEHARIPAMWDTEVVEAIKIEKDYDTSNSSCEFRGSGA